MSAQYQKHLFLANGYLLNETDAYVVFVLSHRAFPKTTEVYYPAAADGERNICVLS